MKKVIRLNERELHRLINESVKRVLYEGGNWVSADNPNNLYKQIEQAIVTEQEASFELCGMDFTISKQGDRYIATSGQLLGSKGDLLSLKSAFKWCWQIANKYNK